MASERRQGSGIPVIIGIVAALLTRQMIKGYRLNFFLETMITIIVALMLWYILTLVLKKKK